MNLSSQFFSHGNIDLQVLWEDGQRVFCRGNNLGNDSTLVFAVFPANEHPLPAVLDRLAREYELRDELDDAWAARPLQLVREDGQTILTLKDPGGEPLDRLIGPPLEIGKFLRLAIALSIALGRLHGRGLVHKDIKPTNVLVNISTDQVWLTGFGIASRLPRERQSPVPPELLEGTLAYIAPEQTGRMNRSIDTRSDLYSLGVMLYQMLTGSLPFTASDPLEWVHCHIAKNPIPPCERLASAPAPVSAIIMKLLAKAAEDRYQTAAGLEYDLLRCLSEARAQFDTFPLGERDVPDRLLIPEKLYGRTREIEALLASFDRIVNGGTAELLLVSGYSGIGKSSVVNELHKVLVPPRGLFASGKFDQYKRDVPYATLAQAFQSLVRQLLGKSDVELAGWREAFREALGPNGRLLTDLVPELELIVGDQPPVPELPLRDAKRRFQRVFRRFIAVFARSEHPLALFLDDLQWLDSASLDLLEDLLTQSDLRHLMLIGAYRDNEVDSAHPLIRKLEAIRNTGAIVHEIMLAPLGREDLGQFIGDALHCKPECVTALTELIHEKTAGNPFFANQLISVLVEEGLLTFQHGEGRWSWDLNSIHAKGYTDNVVDLMVGKLVRLPVETQQALQLLACAGSSAEYALLEMVSQQTSEQMHGQLLEASRAGLVFRTQQSYTFVHDRVHEAAYSSVRENVRAETHLRIGRLLLSQGSPEQQGERIFDIVNQLNRGFNLISQADEVERLVELNLIASRRAKGSTAYNSALSYLRTARASLAEKDWNRHYELNFSIEYNTAECELLTGDLDAAENRLSKLAQLAKRAHDIALVTGLRVTLYKMLNQSDSGIEVALEYLRKSGVDWSKQPSREEVEREYDRIWSQLGSRDVDELRDLPLMTNPDVLHTMDILNEMIVPAHDCDRNLAPLIICRMVNLSLEHGNSDGSCVAYLGLAMIAGPLFGNYKSAAMRFGQLGYDLVEQLGLKRFRPRVYAVFGNVIMPWTRHVLEGRDLLRRAFDSANEMGDVAWAAHSRAYLIGNLLASGESLAEVQREAERSLVFLSKIRFGIVIDIVTTQLALVRTLRGLTPNFGCLNDGDMNESWMEDHLSNKPVLAIAECWYWIRKLQARYLAGDHAVALDAASKAQQLLFRISSHPEIADFHFYSALSHAASWEVAPPGQKSEHLEALNAHHSQLDVWAQNCPENFENRVALIGAEIARIEGRELDAERFYEQAIGSARANGFIHNEALAYELAARFYVARGFRQFAHLYLGNARYGYLRWGAIGKVRQLDERYPDLRQENSLPGPMNTIGAPVDHLDLATVIKVSQAVSSEIVLENLIDSLMRTAIEQAGAQRALLVMRRAKEPRIEAEASTNGDTITIRLVDEAVTEGVLPESVLHYVLRAREIVILEDAAVQSPYGADSYIRLRQARSILCLPLLNQAKLIGVLYLENNLAPNAFGSARIAILKMLASQAAVALENARLYREIAEREKQLTATAEVLRTISSAPSDIQFALDAVAKHATSVCGATNARIWRLEDSQLRLVASYGESSATIYGRHGLPVDRDTVTGRAVCDRRTIHVHDLAAEDAEYPVGSRHVREEGWHTTLATPLLREGEPIGTILVRRMEVRPFHDQQIAFLETFADQAAIAIENMRLFEAEKQRTLTLVQANRDLAEREAKIRRLVDSNVVGIFLWHFDGRFLEANDAFLRIVGYDREELLAGKIRWTDLTPPDWRDKSYARMQQQRSSGRFEPFEKEYTRKDGSRVPVLIGGATFELGGNEGVAYVVDLTARKRAEDDLRESEFKLREIIETMPSMLWSAAPDGEPTHLNQRVLDYSGLLLEDFKRLGWKEFLHPEDFPETAKAFYHAIQTGEPYEAVHRLRRVDGQYRWHHARAEPLRDEEQRIIQWYGLSIDIHEGKRAEDQLRRSEAYLAEAERLSHTGGWAVNRNGERTIAYWSAESYRIFGFDPLQGMPSRDQIWQRIHPDDRSQLREEADAALAERRNYMAAFRVLLPDGTIKHLESNARHSFSADGELLEVMGTFVDVTERRRAEEALRESERSARSAIDGIGGLVAIMAPNGELDALNRQGIEYFGRSLEEMKAWATSDAVHPEDLPRIAEIFQRALAIGAPFHYELRLRRFDGEYRWFDNRGVPTREKSGRVVRWYILGTDIEDRKQAETSLRIVQAELAHVGRVMTLGQLTASIAHEVNQPIGSARNYAGAALNFLDRDPPEMGEVKQALDCIVAAADRAGGIIDRIRDQIKRVPPRNDRFDLNQAIDEVIGLARSMISEHKVSLQIRLAPAMAPVRGDRVQLQQVVLNLVLNAIEAMSTVEAEDRELLISTDQGETSGTLVAVRDSGPGIDPKDRELVFEAFYTTKSGMGMGLSICRSIIAAHGGHLWAAANEGRGALFQFTLPGAEARSGIATPESSNKTFL